jgi:hypothetical protein
MMDRMKTLLVTLLLCAAAVGMAQRPTDPVTTGPYLIGQVICNDNRILDLSGPYQIGGTTLTLNLAIVQDLRGTLVSTGTLVRPNEPPSPPFQLTGRLNVGTTTPLTFFLKNAQPPTTVTATTSLVPPPPPPPPPVVVEGLWVGNGFDTRVRVYTTTTVLELRGFVVPRNPFRGFRVADAPAKLIGPGVFASFRTIRLPNGTLSLPAVQSVFGTGLRLKIPGMSMPNPVLNQTGMELLGAPTPTGFNVIQNKVMLGYGTILVPPQLTQVFRSTFPPPAPPPPTTQP